MGIPWQLLGDTAEGGVDFLKGIAPGAADDALTKSGSLEDDNRSDEGVVAHFMGVPVGFQFERSGSSFRSISSSSSFF